MGSVALQVSQTAYHIVLLIPPRNCERKELQKRFELFGDKILVASLRAGSQIEQSLAAIWS